MKDYIFIFLLVLGAVYFIVKEIRNDSVETKLQTTNNQLQLQYDSLSVEISELKEMIKQLDSVKVYNNNYYSEVIKESDEIIKIDSNAVNGLIRKQCGILSNNK